MNDDILQQTTLLRAADSDDPPEKPRGFTLTVIRGQKSDYGAIFSYEPRTVVIGRSFNADLMLNDPSISKQHCRIRPVDNPAPHHFQIEDLASTNGTRLNGVVIHSPQPIRSGDRIELADTTLRFNTQDDLDSEYQKHLLRLANTDPLTCLLNKASLNKELERLQQYAMRYERPLSLLMIDIDHFKQVNDQYGHLVGDQILTQLARLLESLLRQQDVAGRFGGEEFTVIMPETRLDGALALAERIRGSIAAHPFPIEGVEHRITVSIGVSEHRPGQQAGTALLEEADRGLYAAKNRGRNRIVCQAALP